MGLARIMHEEAHLLNRICQIWSGQGEVLKGPSKASVLRAVLELGAVLCRELGMSVNRSRCRVTLSHASTLKKIQGVLSLGQKKSLGGMRDGDAEEVVQVVKIRHGELGVETRHDAL